MADKGTRFNFRPWGQGHRRRGRGRGIQSQLFNKCNATSQVNRNSQTGPRNHSGSSELCSEQFKNVELDQTFVPSVEKPNVHEQMPSQEQWVRDKGNVVPAPEDALSPGSNSSSSKRSCTEMEENDSIKSKFRSKRRCRKLFLGSTAFSRDIEEPPGITCNQDMPVNVLSTDGSSLTGNHVENENKSGCDMPAGLRGNSFALKQVHDAYMSSGSNGSGSSPNKMQNKEANRKLQNENMLKGNNGDLVEEPVAQLRASCVSLVTNESCKCTSAENVCSVKQTNAVLVKAQHTYTCSSPTPGTQTRPSLGNVSKSDSWLCTGNNVKRKEKFKRRHRNAAIKECSLSSSSDENEMGKDVIPKGSRLKLWLSGRKSNLREPASNSAMEVEHTKDCKNEITGCNVESKEDAPKCAKVKSQSQVDMDDSQAGELTDSDSEDEHWYEVVKKLTAGGVDAEDVVSTQTKIDTFREMSNRRARKPLLPQPYPSHFPHPPFPPPCRPPPMARIPPCVPRPPAYRSCSPQMMHRMNPPWNMWYGPPGNAGNFGRGYPAHKTCPRPFIPHGQVRPPPGYQYPEYTQDMWQAWTDPCNFSRATRPLKYVGNNARQASPPGFPETIQPRSEPHSVGYCEEYVNDNYSEPQYDDVCERRFSGGGTYSYVESEEAMKSGYNKVNVMGTNGCAAVEQFASVDTGNTNDQGGYDYSCEPYTSQIGPTQPYSSTEKIGDTEVQDSTEGNCSIGKIQTGLDEPDYFTDDFDYTCNFNSSLPSNEDDTGDIADKVFAPLPGRQLDSNQSLAGDHGNEVQKSWYDEIGAGKECYIMRRKNKVWGKVLTQMPRQNFQLKQDKSPPVSKPSPSGIESSQPSYASIVSANVKPQSSYSSIWKKGHGFPCSQNQNTTTASPVDLKSFWCSTPNTTADNTTTGFRSWSAGSRGWESRTLTPVPHPASAPPTRNTFSHISQHPRKLTLEEEVKNETMSKSSSLRSSSESEDLSEIRYPTSNIEYIDSHCHVDLLFQRHNFKGTFSKFSLINKFPNNFGGCVAVFCYPINFSSGYQFAEDLLKEVNIWGTFGCHPHQVKHYDGIMEHRIKEWMKHPKTVALGEIGLDYSNRPIEVTSDHELQKMIFRRQLQLALDLKKPLVIHCRDAEEDTLTIMSEVVPRNHKIHRHCFTGPPDDAIAFLKAFPNSYIGLTALVTFPSAYVTHQTARAIPLNRLLLETDTPYFVPRGFRGIKWSHPGMALHVAERIAFLRGTTLDEVLTAVRANTRDMYGI